MPAVIGRVSLPTEFYDRTSAQIARQPLPDFTYAQMLFAANARAELMRVGPEAFQLVAGRGVQDQGAAYPDFKTMQAVLNDELSVAKAILVSDELATGPGHTLRINRPVYSGGGYTFNSRRIGAGGSISTTPITLTDEQVSITIQTNVGPMSASGTGPQPYPISRMDAQRSIHSLVDRVASSLRYDRYALIDGQMAALFDSCSTTLYPGDSANALSSDTTAFQAAGDRPFSLELLMRAIESLKVAKIPRFDDGKYRAILTPHQATQLSLDPLWRQSAKELPEKNILMSQHIGSIANVAVYESNSNAIDTSTVSGVSIQHGVVFGPGMVGYAGTAEGCRVANSTADNYGETGLVVWIAYEGATVVDNRFGVAMHSD